MKTFVPVLALAAGVSATFRGAPSFPCPGNTDNKCTDQQKPGFSWDDLDFGDFFQYQDFDFNGWKCEDGGDKRSRFAPRTFGKKVIGGTCTSDKKKSPSFGCGAAVDKFSLGAIHVQPEFDCDLEFHYDMPDGSTCKHRNSCSKSGTTVVNRQCGGAKNVTIVYPPQPNKPKPSCSIQVPTISFDCSTKPPQTKTKTSKTSTTTTTTPAKTTTTTPADTTTTSVKPSQSTPTATTATSVKPSPSSATETTATSVKPSPSSATGTPATSVTPSPSSATGTTATTVTPSPSSATGTTATSVTPSPSSPTGTPTSPAGSTSAPTSSIPPVTKTFTTSYVSTSTVFTTSTQTITKCEPTVSNCPGNSVVTTVVTIPVSTTICPVTETMTSVVSTSVRSSATTPVPSSVVTSTSVTRSGGSSSSGIVTSVTPIETLPCPSVVPSCLNTFMFTIDCDDNTDADCYCPDATFVKNVYDCLYGHGETDAIIAEAVAYFQGICGKFVSQNPAIATGATVTTYITVTATPTVAPVYTTVLVDLTTVVPCTNAAGGVIPGSSTTVTVSTSMTVPQVGFTTGSTGGVGVIPITAAPVVTGTPSTGGGGAVVTTKGTTLTVPTGTGSFRPTTSGPITAGVGRVGASFGLAAAVAFAAVAL